MKTTLDPKSLLTAAQQTPETGRTQRDKKSLKKSCQDFEAIFVQSLFKSMRKTVPDGGVFKKNNASEVYQDMLDQEVTKKISQQQSTGLAEQLYRQIVKKLPSAR